MTDPESARLERRRRIHEAVSRHLAALGDADLAALLAAEDTSWRASVHGSQSGTLEVAGARVFVKKISLTDIEQAAGETTTNLFGLPAFYQYGVGSSGFGARRELAAYRKAGAWALSGDCPYFPLVHHWRVLPRTAPVLSEAQRDWLEKAPAYWDNSDAVRARLDAIADASASLVVFLEYVPENLHAWLQAAAAQDREAAILRFCDQLETAAAFMNARGMLHFDLNASNILTDGEQVYVADFGLTLCEDFDLSPAERAFFETHRFYDRAYLAWALFDWLVPSEAPPALTPAVTARLERGRPVAKVFGRFIRTLSGGSKATPYPAAEIEAAWASGTI